MSTVHFKMKDYIVELFAAVGGFASVLLINRLPIFMIESDVNRIKLAIIGGSISAVVGWLIRLFLDSQKEKIKDWIRRRDWRNKNK